MWRKAVNPLETVLFTAARNSSALTCRTRWRVLETAAVYTDYVPNAKKIIFSADTPDTVSDLPPASSVLGTFTLPKMVPKRAGFEFVGCAAVSGGEVFVLPGEQIEIYADTTFYAVWKSSYKMSLSPNTLRNNTFESLPNVTSAILLPKWRWPISLVWSLSLWPRHTERVGRWRICAPCTSILRRGSRLRSAAFDNTDRNISCIKIFVLRDLQMALSMCPAALRYS